MVACAHCVKEKLPCKLSSLNDVCGNCYRDGLTVCVPANIPMPDFSKIDRELAKLEKQEEAVEAQQDADEKVIEEAQERLRISRSKMKRLRKQRKLLKRKETEIFEAGREDAEELGRLEDRERFNQELASANPEAPAEAAVIDWSVFWEMPGGTAQAGVGSS
jgi:TolA-binding protein